MFALVISGFKPLHSGAFLLTGPLISGLLVLKVVSNPFIAGHSFLRELYVFLYGL